MNTVVPPPAEVTRITAEFGRRYPGVVAWWGRSTRRWWAMTRDGLGHYRLVEAPDPAALVRRVKAVRTAQRMVRPLGVQTKER